MAWHGMAWCGLPAVAWRLGTACHGTAQCGAARDPARGTVWNGTAGALPPEYVRQDPVYLGCELPVSRRQACVTDPPPAIQPCSQKRDK